MQQGAGVKADVPGIFGATEDDTAKLRIASLYEVGVLWRGTLIHVVAPQIDFGKLEDMPTADGPDD